MKSLIPSIAIEPTNCLITKKEEKSIKPGAALMTDRILIF
jgi:hypothetical protein